MEIYEAVNVLREASAEVEAKARAGHPNEARAEITNTANKLTAAFPLEKTDLPAEAAAITE